MGHIGCTCRWWWESGAPTSGPGPLQFVLDNCRLRTGIWARRHEGPRARSLQRPLPALTFVTHSHRLGKHRQLSPPRLLAPVLGLVAARHCPPRETERYRGQPAAGPGSDVASAARTPLAPTCALKCRAALLSFTRRAVDCVRDRLHGHFIRIIAEFRKGRWIRLAGVAQEFPELIYFQPR